MSESCFVYVIDIQGQDLSKVGISNNPESRLKQLTTGSPFTMDLVKSFELPNREIARSLEGAFHECMKEHRTRGEWFRMTAEQAVWNMSINIYYMLKHLTLTDEERLASLIACGVPETYIERLWADDVEGAMQ